MTTESNTEHGPSDQKQLSRFWPYEPRTAFKVSIVLVPTLLVALVILRETGSDESPTAWELLGAIVVGLIPIILSVLDGVADKAGTVEAPGGLKVTFAAIESVASEEARGVAISSIIGGSVAMNVADSGGRAVMEALRPVLGAETAVLSLGEGNAWWQTRLLLLTSGATRLGRPRVIVFTATESGKENQFLGWARPNELLRVHLSKASKELLSAFNTGQAASNQYELGIPQQAVDQVLLPWATPGTGQSATAWAPPMAIPEMIPEQQLLIALSAIEPGQPNELPGLEMTGEFVKHFFGTVLRRDSIDRSESDEAWREMILSTSEDFCAVTDKGVFVMLFSRQAATTAMLRSLVRG